MATPTFPPGWTRSADGTKAGVALETRDFLQAIRLFEAIAQAAEKLEHHPDLHLESWNRVRIETYSHDVGHLTGRDEALAREIQVILDRFGLRPERREG